MRIGQGRIWASPQKLRNLVVGLPVPRECWSTREGYSYRAWDGERPFVVSSKLIEQLDFERGCGVIAIPRRDRF